MERQKALIDAQAAEILMLRGSKERYARGYRTAKDRIAELEEGIEEISRTHEESLEKQNKLIRAMGDQLRRTRRLSAAESTEYARAKSTLSLPNHISEAEA